MSNKGNRTTEEEREQFITLFKNGYSIKKISELTGWSQGTVAKWLQEKGLNTSNHIHNCKKVIMQDAKGNKTEFNSTIEASNVTKISNSTICHCLSGITKTAGGYKWEREV